MVDAAPRAATSFAYTLDGVTRDVDLEPGATFVLRLSKARLGSFSIQPVAGRIGVTSVWRETVQASAFEADRDIKITRRIRPVGAIPSTDLAVVDLEVEFGPQAAGGCHRVVELVPSGLVPVGVRRGWVDPETGEPLVGVTYPDDQAGQRVLFCADNNEHQRTVRLRYVARTITVGTYRWEPAVVESLTDPDRAALTRQGSIQIR
jgi:hypothetical protein